MQEPNEIPLTVEWLNRSPDKCPRIIESYSIDSSYLTPNDVFTIEFFDDDEKRLDGLELEPVTLLIHGVPQLVGRILTTRCGHNGMAIEANGSDHIADLQESRCDPNLTLKKGMTLGEAMKLAMSPCGITSIVGDDEFVKGNVLTGVRTNRRSGKKVVTVKLEEISPKKGGQGLWEFCNHLAMRHGCTIQPTVTRNELLLSAPSYDQDVVYTFRRLKDSNLAGGNNIGSGIKAVDATTIPTWMMVLGEQGSAGKSAKQVSKSGSIEDILSVVSGEAASVLTGKYAAGRRIPGKCSPLSNGELYRLFYFKDPDAKNQDQVINSAARELGQRFKDLLKYVVTVKGHRDLKSGAVYTVDTIAQVDDDLTRLHERMWVLRRALRFSKSDGSTTELELIRLGSLQLAF